MNTSISSLRTAAARFVCENMQSSRAWPSFSQHSFVGRPPFLLASAARNMTSPYCSSSARLRAIIVRISRGRANPKRLAISKSRTRGSLSISAIARDIVGFLSRGSKNPGLERPPTVGPTHLWAHALDMRVRTLDIKCFADRDPYGKSLTAVGSEGLSRPRSQEDGRHLKSCQAPSFLRPLLPERRLAGVLSVLIMHFIERSNKPGQKPTRYYPNSDAYPSPHSGVQKVKPKESENSRLDAINPNCRLADREDRSLPKVIYGKDKVEVCVPVQPLENVHGSDNHKDRGSDPVRCSNGQCDIAKHRRPQFVKEVCCTAQQTSKTLALEGHYV